MKLIPNFVRALFKLLQIVRWSRRAVEGEELPETMKLEGPDRRTVLKLLTAIPTLALLPDFGAPPTQGIAICAPPTQGIAIYAVAGDPPATMQAPVGSVLVNTAGGAMWVRTKTAWVPFTTDGGATHGILGTTPVRVRSKQPSDV